MMDAKTSALLREEFPNKAKRRRMVKAFMSGKLKKDFEQNQMATIYERFKNGE